MYKMQWQYKACRGWCTAVVKDACLLGPIAEKEWAWRAWASISTIQIPPRLFPDWLYLSLISVPVPQTGDTGTEMSALQQKLSPKQESGAEANTQR
jgi:hypothetical protein